MSKSCLSDLRCFTLVVVVTLVCLIRCLGLVVHLMAQMVVNRYELTNRHMKSSHARSQGHKTHYLPHAAPFISWRNPLRVHIFSYGFSSTCTITSKLEVSWYWTVQAGHVCHRKTMIRCGNPHGQLSRCLYQKWINTVCWCAVILCTLLHRLNPLKVPLAVVVG